jgi:hypothetical protein
MATKAPPQTAPSAFRFGFFAGLGFCCASLLMSVLGTLLLAIVGIGTVGALIYSVGSKLSDQTVEYRPSAASVDHAEPAASRTAVAARH